MLGRRMLGRFMVGSLFGSGRLGRESLAVSEKNACFWFKRKGEKVARLGRSTERGMLAMEAALNVLATNTSLCTALARTRKVYMAGQLVRCFSPVMASRTSLALLQHGEGRARAMTLAYNTVHQALFLGLFFLCLVP